MIVGFIGSGKGSVANFLERDHEYRSFSFASSLKDAVASIFNWPRNLLEGDTDASRKWREEIDPWWTERFGFDVTPRLILQRMGTEACRNNIHDQVWIHSLEARIKGFPDVVIHDCRFPNEVDFVHRLGGKLVRVQRGPDPVWYEDALLANDLERKGEMASYREGGRLVSSPMDKHRIHPSEWKWIGSPVDYTILNDGSLDDLRKATGVMLTALEEDDRE
jgi:hypothetical protein